MVDSRRAAVFSVTMALVFSIPAASQSVEIEEGMDGFRASVDTNFSTGFELNVSQGREEMVLRDSDSRYSRVEKSSSSMEKFVTPEGKLRVEQTPNLSMKIVETPYGTLKTGFRDGKNISEFTGPEELRPRVEKLKQQLMMNATVREREASAKKRIVLDRMLPDVSVTAESTESHEYINVTNSGSEEVSVNGWTVKNSDPDSFTLEETLGPGETVTLYAGSRGNITGSVEDSGVDIDETEDTVVLENRFGRTVDLESW